MLAKRPIRVLKYYSNACRVICVCYLLFKTYRFYFFQRLSHYTNLKLPIICLTPNACDYRNNGQCPATRIQGHVRATQIENVAEKIMRLADDDAAVAADIIIIICTAPLQNYYSRFIVRIANHVWYYIAPRTRAKNGLARFVDKLVVRTGRNIVKYEKSHIYIYIYTRILYNITYIVYVCTLSPCVIVVSLINQVFGLGRGIVYSVTWRISFFRHYMILYMT